MQGRQQELPQELGPSMLPTRASVGVQADGLTSLITQALQAQDTHLLERCALPHKATVVADMTLSSTCTVGPLNCCC